MKLLGQITKLALVILGVAGTYVLSPLAIGQHQQKSESSDPYFRPNANGSEMPRQHSNSETKDGWVKNENLFQPDYAQAPKPKTIIRQGQPKLQSTQSWPGPEIVKNENMATAYPNTQSPARFGQEPPPQVEAAVAGKVESPVKTPWGNATKPIANKPMPPYRLDQPKLDLPSPQLDPFDAKQKLAVSKLTPSFSGQTAGINDVVEIKSPRRRNNESAKRDGYFGDMQLATVKTGSEEQKSVSPNVKRDLFEPNQTNFQPNNHTNPLPEEEPLPAISFARQQNNHINQKQLTNSLDNTWQTPEPASKVDQPDTDNLLPSFSTEPEQPMETVRVDDDNSFAPRQNVGGGSFQVGPMVDSTLSAEVPTPGIRKQPINKPTQRNFEVSDEIAGSSFSIGPTKSQPTETRSKANSIAPTMNSNDNRNTHQFASPSTTKSPNESKASVAKASYQSFEPGRVLALVGGDPIFVGDLLFEANSIIEKFAPTAPASIKKKQRPQIIKKILPKFIDSKLLYVATMRGLPEQVDPDSVLEQADEQFNDQALEKLMDKAGAKSPAEFDAHLRTMGSSLRKLRRSWSKDQLVRFFLSQQLQVDTDVSHQEMLDYYYEHEADYVLPERSKWEQVVIRFDRSKSKEEAKKTIVELGNKIVYGAKLSAVAKESSHGFMASDGGQHDWTSRGSLVLKEIDAAIFELPVGTLSDIIETRDGYHIVRVVERNERSKKSFLDAQIDIKKLIEDEKRDKAFKEHLKKLKAEIPVEVFDFSTDDTAIGSTFTLNKE